MQVAEAALVDLGELGEVLGEFGAGQRAVRALDLLGLVDLVEQELGGWDAELGSGSHHLGVSV